MKKILSILCTVALLCSFMVSVSAAAPTLTVATINAEAGASVDIPITIENNTGLCAAKFLVTYDSALKLTKVSAGSTGLKADKTVFTEPGDLTANPVGLLYYTVVPAGDATNGEFAVLTFTAPAAAGTYKISISVDEDNTYDAEEECPVFTKVEGAIVVKGSTPTYTAKTVTYNVTNGKVIASTTALTTVSSDPADSGSITTAGAAASEDVYFYFFPAKGYTTDGMTINGTEVIGAAAFKKEAVTADTGYAFVFKKIADDATITTKPTGEISGTAKAESLTTFATAAGASEFGMLIAAEADWSTNIDADYAAANETGKIRKYVALEANGDGQFAIELQDAAQNFLKNGTYKARIFAANGTNVKYGDIITITIAD